MTHESDNPPTQPQADNRRVSRREFVTRTGSAVGAAALVGAGWYALYDPTGKAGLPKPQPLTLSNYFEDVFDSFGESDTRMVVARSKGSTPVLEMVRKALEPFGGIKRFVKRNDVVLLKPNVAFDRAPILGATTNPDIVAAVARLCLREAQAAKVIVADNPIETPENCFYKSRITDAAERSGAKVVLPSSAGFREVQIRPGRPDPQRHEALGTWPIFHKPLAQATKVIGLPAIKDHNLAYASMAMKNWYGLLGGRRNQFHQAIHDIISDLGYMISPTLTIADGTRVLMRNGPTGGRIDDVKIANTIVASVDQIATDAWCYENLLERDPAQLTYLQYAHEKFGDGRAPKRFGQRDWKVYQQQDLMKEIST